MIDYYTEQGGFTWRVKGEVLGIKKTIGQRNSCRTPDEVRRMWAKDWPEFIIESVEQHRGGFSEANRVLNWTQREQAKVPVPSVAETFEKLAGKKFTLDYCL